MRVRTDPDAWPMAAVTFSASLFAVALLQRFGVPKPYCVALLGAIAVGAALFSRPLAALAAAIAPAMFADHFFIAPFDQISFAPKDLAVLLGIPVAAVLTSASVRAAVRVSAFLRSRRVIRFSRFDSWLLSLPEARQNSAER